jgi:hypothetical protein
MIRSTRAFPTRALAILCLACACLAPAVAASAAEPAVHYTKESFQAYEKQLAGGQISAVTINKFLRSLRITLKDGRYVLATYPKHEEANTAAQLTAKHVPVTVLVPAAAQKEAKSKPVHHKLRYIAGAIVIVVILIVGAVLMIDRRRKLAVE